MSAGASHLRMLGSARLRPAARRFRGTHPVEQMIDEVLEDGGVQLVHDLLSVALRENEPGIAERAEVSGNGGPGRGELIRDLAGRLGSVAEEVKDLAPGRIGERAESVHGRMILDN